MQCQEVTELMSLELDDLLEDADRHRLYNHLAECPECQRTWAAMQRLSRLLTVAPMATPSPDFADRVMQRIAQRQARRQLVAGYLVLAAGLLLLLALPLASWLRVLIASYQPGAIPGVWGNVVAFLVYVGDVLGSLVNAIELVVEAMLTRLPYGALLLAAFLMAGLTIIWIQAVMGARRRDAEERR